MGLPKIKDFGDYDNGKNTSNYTTVSQAKEFFGNQNELLKALVERSFWQPEKAYTEGDIVESNSMVAGIEAVCIKRGISSSVEPEWNGTGIIDGTVQWNLRYKHYSDMFADSQEAENGTSFDKIMTPATTKAIIDRLVAGRCESFIVVSHGGTVTREVFPDGDIDFFELPKVDGKLPAYVTFEYIENSWSDSNNIKTCYCFVTDDYLTGEVLISENKQSYGEVPLTVTLPVIGYGEKLYLCTIGTSEYYDSGIVTVKAYY